MGSQGQEQYVTVREPVCVRVCVCVGPWENLCGIQLGAHIQATNEQATTCCLRLTWATTQGRGKCCRWVSLSLSLPLTLSPLTNASQSQKFAGTLNFEVSALLRRHRESENVSFQWESGRERERAIWVFYLHLLWFLLSLSLSSPHNLWRLKMNTFRCVCFSLFLLTCTY